MHHPLLAYQSSQTPSQTPPAIPHPKKRVLRWASVQSPRILHHPQLAKVPYPLPKTAVIPVMKSGEKQTVAPTLRKRGRPRKDKEKEEKPVKVRRTRRRTRSSKNAENVTNIVEETVEYLVKTVCDSRV
uniref:Uncharacterized protein n=1 Tax=Caenorhabditis japonica TaxID=281687 RepID=A0A8R1IYP2_CAEJA